MIGDAAGQSKPCRGTRMRERTSSRLPPAAAAPSRCARKGSFEPVISSSVRLTRAWTARRRHPAGMRASEAGPPSGAWYTATPRSAVGTEAQATARGRSPANARVRTRPTSGRAFVGRLVALSAPGKDTTSEYRRSRRNPHEAGGRLWGKRLVLFARESSGGRRHHCFPSRTGRIALSRVRQSRAQELATSRPTRRAHPAQWERPGKTPASGGRMIRLAAHAPRDLLGSGPQSAETVDEDLSHRSEESGVLLDLRPHPAEPEQEVRLPEPVAADRRRPHAAGARGRSLR